MIRVVAILVVIALAVSCLVECVQTDRRQVRYLPKALWLFLIVIPVLGPVAWFVAGRPRRTRTKRDGRAAVPRPPTGPRAPDDDPAFLAQLDLDRRLAAWEKEITPRNDPAETDKSAVTDKSVEKDKSSEKDKLLGTDKSAETDRDPESRGDSGS